MLSAPQQSASNEGQEAMRRLSTFINSLGDGFLAIDPAGLIETSNSMAHDLLDANVLKGQPISQILRLSDADGAQIDIMDLIKKSPAGFTSRDYHINQGSSGAINIFINASPMQSAFGSDSGGGTVLLIRNITREKTLESERDEFISVASHEMRTPVTIAEGSISNAVLLAERSHLPDTITHVLKSAHQQLIFLGALINDLAMLSRADRGKLATTLEEVDLGPVIMQLETDYQPQASKKGLILRAEPSSDLPKIYGSKLHIYEILQNFVTNAIKYTERGLITVKTETSPDGVKISITDSGIGIDKAEQAKLFTKFFRSEDFRVRQISGTGLGLYISAKLAGLLGGSITVSSELDKGSTFSLQLPLSVYHANQPEAAKTVA